MVTARSCRFLHPVQFACLIRRGLFGSPAADPLVVDIDELQLLGVNPLDRSIVASSST